MEFLNQNKCVLYGKSQTVLQRLIYICSLLPYFYSCLPEATTFNNFSYFLLYLPHSSNNMLCAFSQFFFIKYF